MQGDLEQLAIGPLPDIAKLQCSTQITPIIDPEVSDSVTKIQEQSGKHIVMKIHNNFEENNLE